MEAFSSHTFYSDDDIKKLEQLLQIFGSVVSVQDIASAYHQASLDLNEAVELLCNQQESSSGASTSGTKDEPYVDKNLRKPYAKRHYSQPKTKKLLASMGSISGIIGGQYGWSIRSTRDEYNVTKPLKLISSKYPESVISGEKDPSDNAEIMHNDVQNFLFSMLRNGFQLDMNSIKEVLGACGYNVEKSMEKLLGTSASTLEMGDDVLSVKGKGKKMRQCQETSQDRVSAESGKAGSGEGSELPRRSNDRYDLPKEVSQALCKVSEGFEEAPRKILPRNEVKRTRTFGKLARKPLKDKVTECQAPTVRLEAVKYENEDLQDDYEFLRKAVLEHSITMKEYYQDATEALAIGDYTNAMRLLKECQFFMNLARKENERCAEKLVETRDSGEMMSLDLHDFMPKEAVRLLKIHLTSLSGIPPIQYLKLIVGIDGDNTKERALRKRHIKKLLEGDSISWTEEGNSQIILIRIDEINPKGLSFAKK